MNGNITTAPLGGNRNIKTKPLFQYDYGQVLKIVGVTLPAAYEVHFSNQLHGVATTQIGNADGVIIPDIYLTTGEPVYAWIYLHTGNSDGETEYTITIPVVRRASISDAEPTPVQQDVITQAIAALNTAVEQTAQDVQDATEAKQDAEEAAGDAYESAVAAAQSAANANTSAGQAQSAQAASELAQQKAEEAQTGAQTAKWAAESAQTAAEAAQAGAVAARTGAETAQAWAVAARSGAEAAQHAAEAARDEITGLSATANTLPAGAQATASYSDGLLTIGVPKGEKGDHGDTGATPDLTIGTVQTLPAGSSATASITGTAEEPVLNLGIPKGDAGEVTQAEFDALADDVSDMQDTLEHKADIDGYYTDMTVGAAEQVVSSTMVEDNAPYKFRTSGGSTDIGNRAYVDKVVGGTVAWNQAVRDEASDNVTEYADVVTVTDAVEDDAAVSVRVEPVQDLHGQDSPWPAGGGKNLFNSINSIKAGFVNTSGTWNSPSPTGERSAQSGLLQPNTYTISKISSTRFRVGLFDNPIPDTLPVAPLTATQLWTADPQTSTSLTITTNTAGYLVIFLYNGSTESHTAQEIADSIQIEVGSTATAWSPYSNICPISGWDEVNVWDDPRHGGLVEWNQYVADPATKLSTKALPSGTQIISGHKYLLIFNGSKISEQQTPNIYLYIGKNSGVYAVVAVGSYKFYTATSTVTADGTANTNANSVWGYLTADCNWDSFNVFDLTRMFGAGNEPTTLAEFTTLFPLDYYAYNAGETMTVGQVNGETYRHYTIEMPTEAGTVYGGELTVNKDGSGQLVLNRAEKTFDGSADETIQMYSGTRFVINIDGYVSPATNVVDNIKASYLRTVYKGAQGQALWVVSGSDTGLREIMTNFGLSTVTEIRAYLANNPLQVVYPLATPQTYSLTATQVQTILGTNHVWSDAGQLSITYTGTDEHLVLTSGRKYLTRINGTDSMVLGAGQTVTAAKGSDNVHDLTQMFGTAVADYVYQQGSGYFRRWFGGSHYAYNAGELLSVEGLQSHDTVGFNQWDEQWEQGRIDGSGGNVNSDDSIRSVGYTQVKPDTTYFVYSGANKRLYVFFYTDDKTLIERINVGYIDWTFTTPANAKYLRFTTRDAYGTTYNHDICINLSNSGAHNGEYQPYEKHSYPLDSTLTLRGIPKVGASGVYWDGDEYGYDGAVKRRYGVVDLGTLTWYKSQSGLFFAIISDADTNIDTTHAAPIMSALYSAIDSQSITGSDGANPSPNMTMALNAACILYINNTGFIDVGEFKTAMSNVLVVYPLKTPTAETATPYQQIQHVDDWGTEEFFNGTITPVGHVTRYPSNLRDKLQHLPALASSNGSYIITQTDGQMVLSPFPTPPTAAGNYLLKATVSGGNATYSWVAQ